MINSYGFIGLGDMGKPMATNLLNSGTSLTYSSTNASNLAATTELDYFNYSSAASSQNPLEVINAHKAYG